MPSTDKTQAIFHIDGRCARNCAQANVGRARNDGNIDFVTCIRCDRKHAFQIRKAARTRVFPEEMARERVRRRRTTYHHFPNGKAPQALQFLNEIGCRTNNSCTKRKGATTISVQNRRVQRLARIANQPAPRPCQPPWS